MPRSIGGDHDLAIKAIDPDLPVLARPGLRAAVTEAVAAFEADGIALPSVLPGGSGPSVSVPVHCGNTTGGQTIPVPAQPLTRNAYSLAPSQRSDPRPGLLDASVFEAETGGVLGERGARCLREGSPHTAGVCTSRRRTCWPPRAKQPGTG